MYEVEKNIEVPVMRKFSKYPFETMVIGDSFFVPLEDFKHRKDYHNKGRRAQLSGGLRSAAKNWCRSHPEAQFITRSIKRGGQIIGFRCWRTK